MVARPPTQVDPTGPVTSRGSVRIQLRFPWGGTLLRAALMLGAFVLLAEGLARSSWARHLFPLRSVGSRHLQFELKLASLEDLVREEGPINCLILGSSTIHRALNPSQLAANLASTSGCPVRCFNFGVRGLNQATQSLLADILVRLYRPDWLIYGIDVIGLDEGAGEGAETAIEASPWTQYHSGHPTVDGWLVENLLSYRYFLPYRNWMRVEYMQDLAAEVRRSEATDPYGFVFNPLTMPTIASPPDPVQEARLFENLAGYRLDAQNLQGLARVAGLEGQTQLVALEIPLHRTFVGFLPHGQADYDQALAEVEAILRGAGVTLWRTTSIRDQVPDSGWTDRNHLNASGSELFTTWAAERVSELLTRGDLTCHPS